MKKGQKGEGQGEKKSEDAKSLSSNKKKFATN